MKGIFTVSRYDFYDYFKCPKIISLKIHRDLNRISPSPKPKRRRNIQYEIGTIGEETTKQVLSESGDKILDEAGLGAEKEYEEEFEGEVEISKQVYEQPAFPKILEVNLSQKGVQLDTQMKNILRDTLSGLKTIRKYLEDEYGEIRILGRAESKNGVLPGKIIPDFVGISNDMKKPLLIEVKNSARINQKPDNFQASFYNSIAKNKGVLVLQERFENEQNIIIPKTIENVLPETVLVYPRLGEFQKITDTVEISQKIIDEIWQAKQLGLSGKTPHTDCDSSCPHHKLGELPEDNIEPAIPLPLIYAQGLREQGKNLDLAYLRAYISKRPIGIEFNDSLWEFKEKNFQIEMYKHRDPQKAKEKRRSLELQKEKYLDMFSEKTGLSRKTILNLSAYRESPWKNDKKIIKEMDNELHPWQKILGEKKLKKLNQTIKGFTTKIYAIPDNSDVFINRSWKEWE